MCYNAVCSDRKTCDRYKRASCIYKMSSAMATEIEKIRKLYGIDKKQVSKKTKREKFKKNATIEELVATEILEKLRKIS